MHNRPMLEICVLDARRASPMINPTAADFNGPFIRFEEI